MIASLSLESLNSLTTPLRSSQGLVWLGAVQENTHRAGNAIYAPQSQAGSRIARRVMSRVTEGRGPGGDSTRYVTGARVLRCNSENSWRCLHITLRQLTTLYRPRYLFSHALFCFL